MIAIFSTEMFGVRIEDSQIVNSGGYGVYFGYNNRTFNQIMSTRYINTAKAGTRTNLASMNKTISSDDHGNTFDLDDGIAAVLVAGSDKKPEGQLYPLEEGDFYLLDTDWVQYGNFRINPGVHLKFKSGCSFLRKYGGPVTLFRILGEPDNPIIIDSEDGTPGTWGGMLLESFYQIDYVIIKNGGEFMLPGATEKANIVSSYIAGESDQQFLTNSTISNSGGWGIVVESNTLILNMTLRIKTIRLVIMKTAML